jgi:protein gp37
MAENSKIEWTTHTFNPWRGCTKVAAGCANCYADSQAKRNPKTLGIWGDGGTRVVASEAMWREPIKWNAAAEKAGERHRVFCASMADVFEDWRGQVSDASGKLVSWCNCGHYHTRQSGPCPKCGDLRSCSLYLPRLRDRLFALIDATPHLDWLLLTKRPENIPTMWPAQSHRIDPEPYRQNVWLGASIANQADADRNIPLLLKCRELSRVLFLSAEPLLGPIEFSDVSRRSDWKEQWGKKALHGIDWVIAGGESGPHARPMHPDWARSLRDQCQAAGVPFFFKQWGEWAPACHIKMPPLPSAESYLLEHGGETVTAYRVGKKAAGRLLDGREWSEFPKVEATA